MGVYENSVDVVTDGDVVTARHYFEVYRLVLLPIVNLIQLLFCLSTL